MNTENTKNETIGRISAIQRDVFMILYEGKEYQGRLKGTFFKNKDEIIPLVGDYVDFYLNPAGDSIVNAVVNRRNYMERPDQKGHAYQYVKTMCAQGMIANFDYVFIVTSLNGDYSYNRIARYVSIALQDEAIPVVILTKSDMCNNPGRYVREVEGLSEKVRVHAISALYGIGTDELEEYFEPGKTIALLGSSGAGKSTLVNAVVGEEIMKTSEIRESDSKGRHTTTYRQLVELPNGAVIIDTPGMREIGIMEAGDGISDTFEDIIELQSCCKFSDCKHNTEPGCAIKAAINDGSLSEDRYYLFLSLQQENGNNREKMIQIAKWKKQRAKLSKES